MRLAGKNKKMEKLSNVDLAARKLQSALNYHNLPDLPDLLAHYATSSEEEMWRKYNNHRQDMADDWVVQLSGWDSDRIDKFASK